MSDPVVHIIRRADGAPLEARLLDGMKPDDLLVVEREWTSERSIVMQDLLQRGVPRPEWPQSLHWNWARKAPQLKLLESSGFGIVHDQRWQGVMLTKTASHVSQLGRDRGKPLVYIDYLEVAPWNWRIPQVERAGQFRGIGSLLFWRAVRQSQEEGFHGRLGLHALPQAEEFYEKACGMTSLGRDAGKQNLLYLELSSEWARWHLKEGDES